VEVDHFPVPVLSPVDHAEPERGLLVADAQANHPVNGPAHVAFLMGQWVAWDDLNPSLPLGG
jgi:hypothetical protein